MKINQNGRIEIKTVTNEACGFKHKRCFADYLFDFSVDQLLNFN